jgi:hypothetical protein
MKKLLIYSIFFVFSIASVHSEENRNIYSINRNNTIIDNLKKYSFIIQSSTYYIDGCSFSLTATIEFDWDDVPGHYPTNITISNANLNVDCPTLTWEAKEINTEITTNQEGYIVFFKILQTDNGVVDKIMSNEKFLVEFINLCNEYIKKCTAI